MDRETKRQYDEIINYMSYLHIILAPENFEFIGAPSHKLNIFSQNACKFSCTKKIFTQYL